MISLVASRRGAVPEAVTRSESARDTAELSSKIVANAGVIRSDVGSKLGSEETKGVTTVAKSIVQSTFKDLHEIEADQLMLRALPPDAEHPKANSVEDLLRLADTSRGQGWVIAPSSLRRGDPIDVEVELSADPLFRLRTAISEGLVLMDDIGAVGARERTDVERLSQVLERLLSGLVPLQGRVVDYLLVEAGDHELIVHRRLVETLDLSGEELTIVGVASRELFWKDLRRVLFVGARYTTFCRIARSGLQRRWNPVKLVEVMSELAPNLEDQLQQLVSQIQAAMKDAAQEDAALGGREAMMLNALSSYADEAAALRGKSISIQELAATGVLDEAQLDKHSDIETWRDAFAVANEVLRNRFGVDISATEAQELRWAAVLSAGLVDGLEPASAILAPPLPTQIGDSSKWSRWRSTGDVTFWIEDEPPMPASWSARHPPHVSTKGGRVPMSKEREPGGEASAPTSPAQHERPAAPSMPTPL